MQTNDGNNKSRCPYRVSVDRCATFGWVGPVLMITALGCQSTSTPPATFDTMHDGVELNELPPSADVSSPDTSAIILPEEPVLDGCVGPEDEAYLSTRVIEVGDWSYGCALSCQEQADSLCTYACILQATELSKECAYCYAQSTACAVEHCSTWCTERPVQRETCVQCIKSKCLPEFELCSGRS